MSSQEMAAVIYFIRTNFEAEKRIEMTQMLVHHMADMESRMLYHWVANGPDSLLHLAYEMDRGHRKGYKIAQFIENFYKARGYGCCGRAEELPIVGHVWELNFSLSPGHLQVEGLPKCRWFASGIFSF